MQTDAPSPQMIQGQLTSLKVSYANAVLALHAHIDTARAAQDTARVAALAQARIELIESGLQIRRAEIAFRSGQSLNSDITQLKALTREAQKISRRIEQAEETLAAVARTINLLSRLVALFS